MLVRGVAREALLHALTSVGFRFPQKGVMLSLGPIEEKYRFVDQVRQLAALGLRLYGTPGTAEAMQKVGIEMSAHGKDADDPNGALALIDSGDIDLVINIPIGFDDEGRPDGYLIRRCAVDAGVPLLTDRHLAKAVVEALSRFPKADRLTIEPWSAYTGRL